MSEKKFEMIKAAGRVVALVLKEIKKETKTGKCGKDLEKLAKRIMDENGAHSSVFGYRDFPGHICVSVSNRKESELTHGIPTDVPFQKGDLVSADVACYYVNEGKQYHADAAITMVVDKTNDELKNSLLCATRDCLNYAINQIRPGISIRDIGKAIHDYAANRGFYAIREYGGHHIGNQMHEKPFIPNYRSESLEKIKPNSFLCLEPLLQLNDNKVSEKVVQLETGKKWKVVISTNNHLNAHFEHTIFVGEKETLILTDYNS